MLQRKSHREDMLVLAYSAVVKYIKSIIPEFKYTDLIEIKYNANWYGDGLDNFELNRYATISGDDQVTRNTNDIVNGLDKLLDTHFVVIKNIVRTYCENEDMIDIYLNPDSIMYITTSNIHIEREYNENDVLTARLEVFEMNSRDVELALAIRSNMAKYCSVIDGVEIRSVSLVPQNYTVLFTNGHKEKVRSDIDVKDFKGFTLVYLKEQVLQINHKIIKVGTIKSNWMDNAKEYVQPLKGKKGSLSIVDIKRVLTNCLNGLRSQLYFRYTDEKFLYLSMHSHGDNIVCEVGINEINNVYIVLSVDYVVLSMDVSRVSGPHIQGKIENALTAAAYVVIDEFDAPINGFVYKEGKLWVWLSDGNSYVC